MSTTLNLRDKFRRWSYLQDVELWMEPMAGKRRRELIAELRTNLGEAAAEVGMQEAIAELGSPRSLAREYVKSEPRRRPNWTFGWLGAGAVLLAATLAFLGYLFGMADALLGSGGGTAPGRFLGIDVLAEGTTTVIAWELSGWSWPITIVVVLAFVLCSAAWRLVTRPANRP